MSGHEEFMLAITIVIKSNKFFSREEAALLKLIFDTLFAARHKFIASACAAKQDFEFGLRAQKKIQQYTAALTLLERLVTGHVEQASSDKS